MKQNFKLKEVLEFGLKVREACTNSIDTGENIVFKDWDKFCEQALAKKPIDLSGVNNRAAKLTVKEVKEIKQLLINKRNIKAIAEKYNVTVACINNIKYGKTWKDLEPYDIQLVMEGSVYGITHDNILTVPKVYHDPLGAINEWESFELINSKKQFLKHQFTKKEIDCIVNKLKSDADELPQH